MISFIELLVLIFIIFLLGYQISDGDYFSPTCISSLGFVFSVFCCALNSNYWGMTLHSTTIAVIIIGLLIILLAEILIKLLVFKNKKSTSNSFLSTYDHLTRINIGLPIYAIAIVGTTGSAFLYLRQVLRVVVRHGGYSSIASALNTYRTLSSFNVLDLSDAFPGWLNFLYVAVIGLGMFWAYVFVNNYFIDKKINIDSACCIILVGLSVLMNVFNANRVRMIMLAISIALYWWFFWHRINGWKRGLKIGSILKIGFIMICVIVMFFGLRNAVGRNDSRPFTYVITHYFGAPIAGLNSFLERPVFSDVWGKETFAGINNYIGNRFNQQELIYSTQKEFRNIRGINIGNVYTAFRSYIHDFGYLGFVLLTFIEGIFMSSIYYINKKRISKKAVDMRLLLLPVYYYALVLLFYADWFYEQINISIFRMIIILLIVCCIVNSKSIRFSRIRLISKTISRINR